MITGYDPKISATQIKTKTALYYLYDYQEEAVSRLHRGSILNGGVGAGKSLTGLVFWYRNYKKKNLYIITTAKKRDSLEWHSELAKFGYGTEKDFNPNGVSVVIDSWNNIEKYKDITESFFIFDEQKAVGYGKWAKTFIKIGRELSNDWIMLTATPGDTWMDYAPVFIANGFYKNKSEFVREHVVYNNFSRFPQIKRYINCGKLVRLRNQILVNMDYQHETNIHIVPITTSYSENNMKTVVKDYWNFIEERPIENPSEHYYMARKVANMDASRITELERICNYYRKVIVFYNFNYELESIEKWAIENDRPIFQWNGHTHDDIPTLDDWIYLVQYAAGAEGWNCIDTNVIVFYSLNPSYKQSCQAAGRIDRCNTPFNDLYYYVLISKSHVDNSIINALKNKKSFNQRDFADSLKDFHTL